MNISFFTTKNTLGSMVRGKDVATYLGGKYNPTKDFENDVRVYIKPNNLDHVRDCDYVDVSDGEGVVSLLKSRPQIKIIANSLYSFEYIKSQIPNEIFLIPQQHLNWEKEKRERIGIKTCGYIGRRSPDSLRIYGEIKEALNKIDINFITCYDFSGRDRQEAIDFYKSIDLLIVGIWRGDGPFKTPTKLINAASFGIPSIADSLPGYKEFEGFYVPFINTENMIKKVEKFKDEDYYNAFAEKISQKADEYHYSRIAELYKQLT